jgi:flagellar protein FlgJ
MIDNIAASSNGSALTQIQRQAKLEKACAEFESLFLNYMLKSMRSSVPVGGISDQSEEGKMFQSMFDEKLADKIASGGGLGLGEILLRQLGDRLG